MTRHAKPIIAICAGAIVAVAALAGLEPVHADHHMVPQAIAVLQPKSGSDVQGKVVFTQVENGVKIEAHVTGLDPNGKHGFHIHQTGDISADDATSAGGHFNPEGTPHAGPHAEERHVGDLGNLEADADGIATYERVDEHISLDMTDAACIIGRSVIVHGGTDDLESQPSGAAGPRVAAGVIGVGAASEAEGSAKKKEGS